MNCSFNTENLNCASGNSNSMQQMPTNTRNMQGVQTAPNMNGMSNMSNMPNTPGMMNVPAGVANINANASNLPMSTPYLSDEFRNTVSNSATKAENVKTAADLLAVSNGNLSNSVNNDINNPNMNIPESVTNTMFWPAYLRKFIGNWVRVDFFIGNSLEERIGQLLEVGASYIVLNVLEPETVMICDIFAIKFVTVVLDSDYPKLYM